MLIFLMITLGTWFKFQQRHNFVALDINTHLRKRETIDTTLNF